MPALRWGDKIFVGGSRYKTRIGGGAFAARGPVRAGFDMRTRVRFRAQAPRQPTSRRHTAKIDISHCLFLEYFFTRYYTDARGCLAYRAPALPTSISIIDAAPIIIWGPRLGHFIRLPFSMAASRRCC